MRRKRLTQKIRGEADKVVTLARPEDVPLGNIAYRMAAAHLRYHGWYGCTIHHDDGRAVKTLFVVRP